MCVCMRVDVGREVRGRVTKKRLSSIKSLFKNSVSKVGRRNHGENVY